MPLCPDGQTTVMGICPTGKVINIQCIPDTTGMPNYTPAPDQIPIAHDAATDTLWVHTCENSWVPFSFDICTLPASDISGLGDPCTAIGIAVAVDNGVGCTQGVLPLAELAAEVAACENLTPDTNDTSVVVPIASGNEIATHDDGTGNLVSIQETITSLASDGTDGLDYTDEDGVISNIPAGSLGSTSILAPVVSGQTIATHNDGTGTLVDIEETITGFTPDGSGGFNYEAEDGTIYNIPVDVLTTLVDNGNNTITYTNEGAAVTLIPLTQVTEGLAIDVTGIGSAGNPYVVSLDLCELTIITNQQVTDAGDVKIAACVDGVNVLMSVQSATSTVLGVSLTLVLDNNAEVVGVNYNTVEAAISYALSVLQIGGKLILTLAASTVITELVDLPSDFKRIDVFIVGTDEITSEIDFLSGTIFTSNIIEMTLLKTSSLSTFQFINNSRVVLDRVTTTQGISFTDVSFFDVTFCTLEENANQVIFVARSQGEVNNTSMSMAGFAGTRYGIRGDFQSQVITHDNSYFFTGTGGSFTGIDVDGNTTILTTPSETFDGNETAQYNPVLDLLGTRFRSAILSA